MKSITLIGKPGTGTTFTGYQLAERFDGKYVSTSGLMKKIVGDQSPRKKYVDFAASLREESPYRFAQWTLEQLNDSGLYVIDRMVFKEDIEYLRDQGSFVLVLTCSLDEVTRRIIEREDVKDRLTGDDSDDANHIKEMYEKDPTNLDEVRKLASYVCDTTQISSVLEDTDLVQKLEKSFMEFKKLNKKIIFS